jgi:hypothetical protein
MSKNNIPTLEAKSILVEPIFDIEYTRTEIPGMIGYPDDFEIEIVKVKMNGFDVLHILSADQLNEIQTNIEEQESTNPTKQHELYTHDIT